MRILVACEFSGVVRDAFIRAGHESMSCDLLPTESPGPHYQGDVIELLQDEKFDLMIAHPPCTDLAVSGALHFQKKRRNGDQRRSIEFFMRLVSAPVERICIENPIGIMSTHFRKPDQIIQPWMFGHKETKATCLWLKNLPVLKPTEIVGPPETEEEKKQYAKCWRMGPSPDRGKLRSIFWNGVAKAMAEQWSKI